MSGIIGGGDIRLRVASRLRTARLLAGLTQAEVGDFLGVKFQQVQKYENGTNRISAERLFLFASALGREVSWFFEEVEDPGTVVPAGCGGRQFLGVAQAWPYLTVETRDYISHVARRARREAA